jgi:hypothetical protein
VSRVRAGFFSFTEVTDPGQHRAYNEWHMLDHMPEQFALAGVALGQRWVLTPDAARRAVLRPPFERVHYVTLYLMTDPLAATLDDFAALGASLHAAEGRWFDARRAHVSGPWRVDEMRAAQRVQVRAEVLPARPHRAVHITVGGSCEVASVCELPGVAGAWSFAADASLVARRRGGVEAPIRLAWLDHLDAAVPDADSLEFGPDVLFAATLHPITPWEWDWFDRPQ